MPYFTDIAEIQHQIAQLSQAQRVWLDTEVADYVTKSPRLSLIQVLEGSVQPTELSIADLCDRTCILDVLDQPSLVQAFIEQVMQNPAIEKIIHNASYDLRFLGGTTAQNITCTLQIAKKIPYYCLPVPNHQLKTLAAHLCNLTLDKTQRETDWSQRPLTTAQLDYAWGDPAFLAKVHTCLLALYQQANPDPASEDLETLARRYLQIQREWKHLDTELAHLKQRLLQAMQVQAISETPYCKLASYRRVTKKVQLVELLHLMQAQDIDFDMSIALSKSIQDQLGDWLSYLAIATEESVTWQLQFNHETDDPE